MVEHGQAGQAGQAGQPKHVTVWDNVGVVRYLLGIHPCLLSTVLTFPESDDPTPGKISVRTKNWPVMTLV